MTHKEIAQDFLQKAASGQVQEAYERYAAKSFKHHNPYFPGDAASLQKGMEDAHKTRPNRALDVARVIDDGGDLVAVHSRVTRQDPAAQEIAAVHIFRFEGDRIAELWDVAQELPKDSPNKNGAF
jgi:predicted SnoaL-like aldol condensation-catalyzing enzyme